MVDLKLYLLCAFGGFALYFLGYSIMYGMLRRPVGIAYYQGGQYSTRKEQVHAFTSGVLVAAVLIFYYQFRITQPTPMSVPMYIFVALATLLSARSMFPLVMEFILPAGIYENGIVTTRGFIRYRDIKSYDFYDSGKRRDADVVYIRIYTMKSKLAGVKMLVVDKEDKAKVQKIMKQRMASYPRY